MKKIYITILATFIAFSLHASVSFSGTAILNTGFLGLQVPPGNTSLILIDEAGDGFGFTNPGSVFVGDTIGIGDSLAGDRIVGYNATSGNAGFGVTTVPGGTTYTAPINTPFAFLVFENQTDASVVQIGSTYQYFTNASWLTPADGGSASFGGAGAFTQLAGVSSTSLSAVPEPSTYALFAGILSVSFVAVRRHRSRSQA